MSEALGDLVAGWLGKDGGNIKIGKRERFHISRPGGGAYPIGMTLNLSIEKAKSMIDCNGCGYLSKEYEARYSLAACYSHDYTNLYYYERDGVEEGGD